MIELFKKFERSITTLTNQFSDFQRSQTQQPQSSFSQKFGQNRNSRRGIGSNLRGCFCYKKTRIYRTSIKFLRVSVAKSNSEHVYLAATVTTEFFLIAKLEISCGREPPNFHHIIKTFSNKFKNFKFRNITNT